MSDQLIAYLSEQLKQRRWSQRTLAMYADISPNTVSYAMQGKTIPDPETIEKMARALNVDAYHMLRLAGHVEGPRQSIADPRVSLLAQRVDALPSDVRQRVVPALDAVIDAMVGPVAEALGRFVGRLLEGVAPLTSISELSFELARAFGATWAEAGVVADKVGALAGSAQALLGPIISAVTQFVSWKDVLAVLAVNVASVLLPALAAVVTAVAPVIAVFAGMVLAVLGTIVVALYALSSYKEATSFLALVVWAFSALSVAPVLRGG